MTELLPIARVIEAALSEWALALDASLNWSPQQFCSMFGSSASLSSVAQLADRRHGIIQRKARGRENGDEGAPEHAAMYFHFKMCDHWPMLGYQNLARP